MCWKRIHKFRKLILSSTKFLICRTMSNLYILGLFINSYSNLYKNAVFFYLKKSGIIRWSFQEYAILLLKTSYTHWVVKFKSRLEEFEKRLWCEINSLELSPFFFDKYSYLALCSENWKQLIKKNVKHIFWLHEWIIILYPIIWIT